MATMTIDPFNEPSRDYDRDWAWGDRVAVMTGGETESDIREVEIDLGDEEHPA